MSRSNRLISLTTALLVAFLALAAFRLSFDALRHLAAANGVAINMAWLYPAIIDGAIIIFSLSVLQAGLNRDRTRYPWFLVALFTLLSIALNIIHAPGNLLGRLLAAVPPVALFLSFELLITQIKGMVQRTTAFQSLQELLTAVQQKRTELDTLISQKQQELNTLITAKQTELDGIVQERQTAVAQLNTHLDKLTAKKDKLLDELKTLKQEKRTALVSNTDSIAHARAQRQVQKEQSLDTLLIYLSDNPDASLSDIAAVIGRSRSTAGNYVNELTTDGRLHKNGHGWEVLDEQAG
jgi:hypothetical protein